MDDDAREDGRARFAAAEGGRAAGRERRLPGEAEPRGGEAERRHRASASRDGRAEGERRSARVDGSDVAAYLSPAREAWRERFGARANHSAPRNPDSKDWKSTCVEIIPFM